MTDFKGVFKINEKVGLFQELSFTLKDFKLKEIVVGKEIGFEDIEKVGIYEKDLNYFSIDDPTTCTLIVVADVRDGEMLEVYVVEN